MIRLGVVGALVFAVGGGTAAAQEPGGWTAPAYPGNTLTMTQQGTVVAGTVVRVAMAGHAEWGAPTDESTTHYDLSLFVQNAAIEPACAGSYGAQLQMGIMPFVIKPGLERVLLCGFQRYVIDDVAGFQLPVRVEQPACRAVHSSVRRGSRLRLRCNVSGPVTVRFRGARKRDVPSRLSSEDGTGSVSTRRLARGRYRVTVWAGELRLGRTFRVRVR